jgi:hypothetical protein
VFSAVDLRDEVKRSSNYSKELNNLSFFAGKDEYILKRVATLDKFSRVGIASVKSIKEQCYINADKIAKHNLLENKSNNLINRFIFSLSHFVVVTKVNGQKNSGKVEDVLARACASVESGDLDFAISEVRTLSEPDRKLYAAWLQDAINYVDSINAAEEILRYLKHPLVDSARSS